MLDAPIGEPTVIEAAGDLDTSAALELHAVAGIDVAQILAPLIGAARGDFGVIVEVAAFVQHLRQIVRQAVRQVQADPLPVPIERDGDRPHIVVGSNTRHQGELIDGDDIHSG